MNSNFSINVAAPKNGAYPFTPFVTFRLDEFKCDSQLMTPSEIDFQIDLIIDEVNKLRSQAKKKLKEAKRLEAERLAAKLIQS